MHDYYLLLILPCLLIDGLARAKTRRAADADNFGGVCSGGIFYRLCFGLLSNDATYICWRSCSDYSYHRAQLAVLQPPPSQMVGS